MKKIFSLLLVIVMTIGLCSCGKSTEQTTAKSFIAAMADKDYEKAAEYSTENAMSVIISEYGDKDFNSFKFKEQNSDDEKLSSFVFENKNGDRLGVLVTKSNGKVFTIAFID